MLLKIQILTGESYPPPLLISHFYLCLQFYHTLSSIHEFCVKKPSRCSPIPGSCALSKAQHMPRCGYRASFAGDCPTCGGRGLQGLFRVLLAAAAAPLLNVAMCSEV